MFRILNLSMAILMAAGSLSRADAVPELLGRQVDEAREIAGKAGVALVVQMVGSLERRGRVLLQIPGAGSEIGKDRQLFLRVSDGMPVPGLEGLPKAEAEAALDRLGIGHEASDRRHDGLNRGTVAGQLPIAGTRMDASLEVVFLDLVGGRYVTVPDVSGRPLAEALKAISQGELAPLERPGNADLADDSRSSSRRDCRGIDIVVATAAGSDPPAGAEVYPGTVVNLAYTTAASFTADDICPPRVPDDPCERHWSRWCNMTR